MDQAFEEDLDVVGPSLLAQTAEGTDIPSVGDTRQGQIKRYTARKYTGLMQMTQEAQDDNLFKETYDLARMLKRVGRMTVDFTSTAVIARAWNSSYLGADGVPLCSTAHPIGGSVSTFSNTLATPMSPSEAALTVIATAVMDFVGHDGLPANHSLRGVVHPNAQWAVWSKLLKSDYTPEPGNFAAINVVKKDLDIKPIRNPFWTDSTTNYLMLTNCDNGLKFKWRKKLTGRSWVEERNESIMYSQSGRWDVGWTNPRGVFGSGS
jgi:hypothetical protein